ncbi:unnamed protein product [Dicrocoelium dendriticum]|nr:unnamed protein product [Dicrocoelium dendriticum]
MSLHDSNFRTVASSSNPDIPSSFNPSSPRIHSRVTHVTASDTRLPSLGDADFTCLRSPSTGFPHRFCSQANVIRGQPPLRSSNNGLNARELVRNVDDFIELDLGTRSLVHSDGDVNMCSQLSFDLYPFTFNHSMAITQPHRSSCPASATSASVPHYSFSSCDTYYDSWLAHSKQNGCSRCITSSQVSAPVDFDPVVHFQARIPQRAPAHRESEAPHPSNPPAVSTSLTSAAPPSFSPPGCNDRTASPGLDKLPNTERAASQDSPVLLIATSNPPTSCAYAICDNSAVAGHSSMLLQTCDLAVGGSLICTVVNILRGLRLLDRCGLEDLCTNLYGLQHLQPKLHACNHLSVSQLNEKYCADPCVTRSSSFTSPALISPRRSILPRDNFHSVDSQKSVISSSVYPHKALGCIARFVLACSLYGSSLPQAYSRFSSPSTSRGRPSNELFADDPGTSVAATPRLRSADWKRGCSSNLVTLLSSVPSSGLKRSSVAINRLLAGRFLPGPNGWRSAWPHSSCSPNSQASDTEELARWISCWIRCGAVIVLAELQQPSGDTIMNNCHISDNDGGVSELVWQHRLVYGISKQNEVFLSNPTELASVKYVLQQLSVQTTIHLEKRHLAQLWHEHNRYHVNGLDSSPTRPLIGSITPYCSGDFSVLACQQDCRWNEMNVLGQVLQTLRSVENEKFQRSTCSSVNSSTSVHSSPSEEACLSPTIVIPSSQSPGFSVFLAKSDWKLVHALYQPVRRFD